MKNTVLFRSSMVRGILTIMLLGAVAAQGEENQPPSDTNPSLDTATNSVAAAAQPAEVDPDSSYGELVRLLLAGVDQSVILSYVESSVRFFELDADRIIYLTELETPSEIIAAAMERDKQLLQEGIAAIDVQTAEDTEVLINPPEVTEDYLYDSLTPHGSWIYIEGYGRCWQPTVVTSHADWRPYCDNGRWVYTDSGWYWMSDYSWGWAAFHYGRWFRHARYGWCWWPDTVWAPSWVSWRYDRTYCGWAPLPPYTSCRSGAGIVYRGSRVSVGFNFGLDSDCYTFVATKYFCDPKPRRYCLDRRDAKRVYDRTRVLNRINYDLRKKRVVNGGISPKIISTLSRQTITPVTVRHTGSRAGSNNRREQLNRDTRTLVVSRPNTVVSQGNRSSVRVRNGTRQDNRVQQQRTYAATAGRNTVRQPAGRVNRAKPSGTRQPGSVSQARQRHVIVPAVGTTPQRPATRNQTPSQRTNRGKAVSQGNRSPGKARPQTQNRNARPKAPQSGRSNNAGQGNGKPAKGRSAAAPGSQ